MRTLTRRRRALLGVLPLLLMASVAFAQDADDPVDELIAAYRSTEDSGERMTLLRTFLADHPDHEFVPEVVRAAGSLGASVHGDRAMGIALAELQLDVTTDADVLAGIRSALVEMCDSPVYATRLAKLVEEHMDPATASFSEQLTVLESAVGAEAWTLVDTWSEAAMKNATAEQYAADYPDDEHSAEDLAEAGANREGLVETFRGWSLANQGEVDRALEHFEKADRSLRRGFTGVPSNDLYRFWGQALAKAGHPEKGLEKLVLAAAFNADGDADALAREHHAAAYPGEDFDDFAWDVRAKRGPKIEDFVVTDYEGRERKFSELKGREATLLAFWFPT